MTTRKRFIIRLKPLRTDRGMTQEALADTAGISRGYLARLETGTSGPTLTTLKDLAKAFKVTVGELMEEGRRHP
jgi:transcriptional regulator with XRE-family HTH domain